MGAQLSERMSARAVLALAAASLLAVMLVFVLSSPQQQSASAGTASATFLDTNLYKKKCTGTFHCGSGQRCKGSSWMSIGHCIDKIADNADCMIDHKLASSDCLSGKCQGVHFEGYCMPVVNETASGFADGTRCAYDSDCEKNSAYCLGGGVLPTWIGQCTSCPSYCGSYGCHTCDNTNSSIKCNNGPVNFWGQTMGCVPAAAKNDYNKLQQCILEEEESETGTSSYAAAQAAAKDNLRTCMLSAVSEGQKCFQNVSGCDFQFGCLHFGDMAIASGALASVAQGGGRRMLQVIDKTLNKAWLLRNFSKTIHLGGSNSKDFGGNDFSGSETHAATILLGGSADFRSILHVGMNFGTRQYDITFAKSGVQLDLSTTLDLSFNAAAGSKKDDGSGTIYSHTQEYAITDETGGLCADPSGSTCLAKQIYSQLYMLAEVPVLVQVSYQIKTLIDFTAKVDASFNAQLNYSQFFGFKELGVSLSDGKAAWTVKADSFVPEVAHTLGGDASGVIDLKSLVGVELTVAVNGVKAKALIGGWSALNGDFNIGMLADGTGLSVNNKASEFCGSGHLKAGLAPGLRLKVGTGITDVLKSFVAQCGPTVSKTCDTKAGKVANCWVNAVGEFDPCKDAESACQILGKQAHKMIDAPANEGYFPLGADQIQLSVPIFDKETKGCGSKKATQTGN